MEEGHVTVDGQTHDVGRPFMVIATQNPIEQAGTYQLPEAQLDRFLMRTSLGHPDAESTEALLAESRVRDRAAGLAPVSARRDHRRWPELADVVHVDRAIITYVRRLAEASREVPDVRIGLSTRGAWPGSGRPRPGRWPRDAATSCPRTSPPSPTRCWATAC